jgi:Zn-dependent metalloprotease
MYYYNNLDATKKKSDNAVNWKFGKTVTRDGMPIRHIDNPVLDGISIDHVADYNDADPITDRLHEYDKLGGGVEYLMDPHYSSGIFNKVLITKSKSFLTCVYL